MSATKNYICQLEDSGIILFGDPNVEAAELLDAQYHQKMLEQAQEQEEISKDEPKNSN